MSGRRTVRPGWSPSSTVRPRSAVTMIGLRRRRSTQTPAEQAEQQERREFEPTKSAETAKALASSVITATSGSASCEILRAEDADRLRRPEAAEVAVEPQPAGSSQLHAKSPAAVDGCRPARTPRPAPTAAPRKSRSSRSTRRWNRLRASRRPSSRHALPAGFVVGALDHVQPRHAPVEALRQRAHAAACARPSPGPARLEHLQVVRRPCPSRSPTLLGELGRRRRPLAQEGDDAAAVRRQRARAAARSRRRREMSAAS